MLKESRRRARDECVRERPVDGDAVVNPDGRNVSEVVNRERQVARVQRLDMLRSPHRSAWRQEGLGNERGHQRPQGEAEVEPLHEGGTVATPQVQAPHIAASVQKAHGDASDGRTGHQCGQLSAEGHHHNPDGGGKDTEEEQELPVVPVEQEATY